MDHEHCWHQLRGPIWMVIPDGDTVQKCCRCEATRVVHIEHTHEASPSRLLSGYRKGETHHVTI